MMTKKKKAKAAVSLFFAVLFSFVSVVCVFAKAEIPSPTERFFINDYAGVIDDDTENYIYEKGKLYADSDGTQAVVLTMENIDGYSVEDFSIETARAWGLGDSDKNNGVLILLVIESRDIRIEVGYGLESVLTDSKCGRFIRNASDMLSSGDYSGGIKHIYDEVVNELENPSANEDENEDEEGVLSDLLAAIIVGAIIIIIWLIAARRGGGGSNGGSVRRRGKYYGGFGGFLDNDSGFGGGGFSGGGGSFGGGGASGKF